MSGEDYNQTIQPPPPQPPTYQKPPPPPQNHTRQRSPPKGRSKTLIAIVAVIGVIVGLFVLPVIIILWYVINHDLPGIGPFESGSPGSAFIWLLIFALIYAAIISIPIAIIKRKRGERWY